MAVTVTYHEPEQEAQLSQTDRTTRGGLGEAGGHATNLLKLVQTLWNCCRQFSEIRVTRSLLWHSDFTKFNFGRGFAEGPRTRRGSS